MIPYGRQSIADDDIEAVVAVLRSDFLTQGPAVPAFEDSVAARVGAAHAVAVNSATSALHIACLALGVGQGDVVWTSPVTFVASANCALYCGAEVDFVDIDPVSFNLCPDRLEEKLARAAASGRLPKAIIAVHLTGQPCEIDRIGAMARSHGVKVIEDASHAIGASFGNYPVGACEHSDIAVFSFHPVKIVTSGEGGMATTQDREVAARMSLLRTHGITRDPEFMTHAPDGPWYYQQVTLGYNYRMTDLQAALGRSQLEKLDDFVAARHEIADQYDANLAGMPLKTPVRLTGRRSALHLYVIHIGDEAPLSHLDAFNALRAHGIGVNLHYIPVHLQPWYRKMGFGPGDFPEAERYYSRAISLPIFPELTRKDQQTVIDTLVGLLGRA